MASLLCCRNAQHVNNVSHIVTIRGQTGFYDTFKGWALGMLQVGVAAVQDVLWRCVVGSISVHGCSSSPAQGLGQPVALLPAIWLCAWYCGSSSTWVVCL